MKLWEFSRKNVEVTLLDNETYKGFVQDFCDAQDNDEEVDSILVDISGSLKEFFEYEIKSIKVI